MSYVLDGKASGQRPKYKLGKVFCEKCSKIIDEPYEYVANSFIENCGSPNGVNGSQRIYHYINKENLFIYESKSGTAATYCSSYCKEKHNHRFRKQK